MAGAQDAFKPDPRIYIKKKYDKHQQRLQASILKT
jgi:hypothetical protein